MAVELSTPSFKPREYEGEKIEYLVYGLDDEGNEIECIDGPVDTPDSAAGLAEGIVEQFPDLYFHVTAVLNDANGKMEDSEVVWSNFPEEESKKTEEIEYEKGHKNSRGEDAPWVIRDHKGGKVLASFPTKKEAENHMRTMKRYSKNESSGAPYIQRYVITGGTGPKSGTETARRKIKITGDPEQELWDLVLSEIRAGYEQRLFVNDTYYDCVGSDEGIAELREEGLAAFKEEYGIDKITSMGYYKSAWGGWMSDQIDYRIVDGASSENKDEGASAFEARAISYFILGKDTAERNVEKFVSTLEDAVLKDQSVETTAEPDGAISVDIYGQLSPNEVERILQAASQLGIYMSDLAVNINP